MAHYFPPSELTFEFGEDAPLSTSTSYRNGKKDPAASGQHGLSATRSEVSVTQILVSFTLFLLGKVRCQQGP